MVPRDFTLVLNFKSVMNDYLRFFYNVGKGGAGILGITFLWFTVINLSGLTPILETLRQP